MRHAAFDLSLIDNEPQSESTHPGYAARRWARVVFALTNAEEDVSNIATWATQAGVSSGALKTWCTVAGVHARDSLDFGRVLRVVKRHHGRVCDWHNAMAIVDPRTLTKLLIRAGIAKDARLPDVATFLVDQRFIAVPVLLAAIRLLVE